MKSITGERVCSDGVTRRGNITDATLMRHHHLANHSIVKIFRVDAHQVFPCSAWLSIEHEGNLPGGENAVDEQSLLSPKLIECKSQVHDNARTANATTQTVDCNNRSRGFIDRLHLANELHRLPPPRQDSHARH